jgi:hypothetical protein
MFALHEDVCTLMIISCSNHPRVRNVSDKHFRESQSTHFTFNNFFFFKSCRLWDSVEKYGKAWHATDMTIWGMCFACWIPKATYTHSQYVILIAFNNATTIKRTRLSVMSVVFNSLTHAQVYECTIPLTCSTYQGPLWYLL